MSSVPNPTSRSLARAAESVASTGWIPQALLKAAMGLALLAGGVTEARAAKPTFGLEVGIGMDVPNPELEVDCENDAFEGYVSAKECKAWAPRPGGRLRAPIRFALSEHAAFVLRPGIEGGQVISHVTWDRVAGCDPVVTSQNDEDQDLFPCDTVGLDTTGLDVESYDYAGHFGFMAVPSLGAGIEARAPISDSISLVGGVSVSVGYVWMFQSVGATDPGLKHKITGEAYDGRIQDSRDPFGTSDPVPAGSKVHCGGPDGVSCNYDLILTGFRPGAELSFGIVTHAASRPVTVQLSYGVSGRMRGPPNNYNPSVRVKYMMWNPVMLTLGTTFGG